VLPLLFCESSVFCNTGHFAEYSMQYILELGACRPVMSSLSVYVAILSSVLQIFCVWHDDSI
jgi:hypothetical protein